MKSFRFSGRAAVVCSVILALGIPTVAMGFGEGRSLLLGKRNPSSNANLALNAETEIIANTPSYGTRQSNKRDGDGGGAIYGCRSNLGNEPCIRANNLKGGHAFQFVTTGTQAGRIEVGNASGAPFTTNATGVATGLNADKVDGKEAADFAAATDVTALAGSLLAAQVAQDGTLGANGRGAVASAVNGNVYTVKFNRDVSKCTFSASPVGSPGAAAPGVAATPNAADSVNVELSAPGSFHLQVIC
jgi:hypothetical protein